MRHLRLDPTIVIAVLTLAVLGVHPIGRLHEYGSTRVDGLAGQSGC